jgi:hypothetical protein
MRGIWWLPVSLILIVLVSCRVGEAWACALPRLTVASAGIPAAVPDTWLKSRTPTPTPTIPIEPLLTAVHDALGTPEITRTPVFLGTEIPATPTPVVPLVSTFEDPNGFFALDYPEGWIVSPRGGALLAPTGGGGLSMSIEVKAVTPQTLLEHYVDWYAGQVEDYVEMDRTEGTLSGYPALWIEQSFSSSGVPHRGVMVAAVRNRVGFVFTGWVPQEQAAGLKPILRAMIQSVRIAESPAAPPYAAWLTHRTPHLTFHYLPDTWIEDQIEAVADLHETAFTDNVAYLDVDYAGPIDVYIYASEESFVRATARDAGFAINEFSEVHTRWFAQNDHQTPGHEITHVITFHSIGDPTEALLGEGVAVWLDHGGNDYHRQCAELKTAGRLVPLAELLGEGWDGSAAAYYEAGSFIGFLLNTYGVERFTTVYAEPDLPAALKKVYRASLATLEKKWLRTLE